MKKIICVLLIAVVLLTGSAALAANVPKPVLDARESTVYIEVENDEGVFSGSGFAIGTADTIEYVVTNHHVIEGDNGTSVSYTHLDVYKRQLLNWCKRISPLVSLPALPASARKHGVYAQR